jgi:hypothetical protein
VSGPVEIVLVVAAVGYVLLSRMLGEPVEGKRLLLVPAVLGVVGLAELRNVEFTGGSLAFLAVTAVLGVAVGVGRGASARVFVRDGIVCLKYTWLTVALWAGSLAVKVGAGAVASAVDPEAVRASGSWTLLSIAVGLLAEGVTVVAKAMRVEGQIVWAKGRDGRPHRTSARLDELHRRLRDRQDPVR